jgi:hypothetical protein
LAINFRSLIPGTSLDLFDADDLNTLSYPLGGKIDPPAIPALFDLFLNHLFAVDFKLCFSGERRFFHREGDVRTALFSFVSYNLGKKVMMNDRQTFFPLRGALSCYIEQTI